MENHESIRQALVAIAHSNGGIILPQTVVDAARNEGSPLHNWFCWENDEAAEKYRLIQARDLIRTVRVEIGDQSAMEVRAFVSLTTDRADGGYRLVQDVLSDEQLYRQLLRDALAEMVRFEQKYSRVKELAPLFREARKIKNGSIAA